MINGSLIALQTSIKDDVGQSQAAQNKALGEALQAEIRQQLEAPVVEVQKVVENIKQDMDEKFIKIEQFVQKNQVDLNALGTRIPELVTQMQESGAKVEARDAAVAASLTASQANITQYATNSQARIDTIVESTRMEFVGIRGPMETAIIARVREEAGAYSGGGSAPRAEQGTRGIVDSRDFKLDSIPNDVSPEAFKKWRHDAENYLQAFAKWRNASLILDRVWRHPATMTKVWI